MKEIKVIKVVAILFNIIPFVLSWLFFLPVNIYSLNHGRKPQWLTWSDYYLFLYGLFTGKLTEVEK